MRKILYVIKKLCKLSSEKDVLSQGTGHPRGGSDVGDIVGRTGPSALQGLEPRSRDADHRIAAGKPDVAGRLAPERLGFDSLVNLPILLTVNPCVVHCSQLGIV